MRTHVRLLSRAQVGWHLRVLTAALLLMILVLAPADVIPAASTPPGAEDGFTPSEAGLERVQAIGVAVGSSSGDWMKRLGLSEEEISAQVRASLRRVPGLRVERNPGWETPTANLALDGILIPRGQAEGLPSYAVMVRLAIVQPVFTPREVVAPGDQRLVLFVAHAVTWEKGIQCAGPARVEEGDAVRQAVSDLLDRFQNEYRKANRPESPVR